MHSSNNTLLPQKRGFSSLEIINALPSKRAKREEKSEEVKIDKNDIGYPWEDFEEFTVVYLKPKETLKTKNLTGFLFYDIDGTLIDGIKREAPIFYCSSEVKKNNDYAIQQGMAVALLTARTFGPLQFNAKTHIPNSAETVAKTVDPDNFSIIIFSKNEKFTPMEYIRNHFAPEGKPIPKNKCLLIEDQFANNRNCHKQGYPVVHKGLRELTQSNHEKDYLIMQRDFEEDKNYCKKKVFLNDILAVRLFIEGNLLSHPGYQFYMQNYLNSKGRQLTIAFPKDDEFEDDDTANNREIFESIDDNVESNKETITSPADFAEYDEETLAAASILKSLSA